MIWGSVGNKLPGKCARVSGVRVSAVRSEGVCSCHISPYLDKCASSDGLQYKFHVAVLSEFKGAMVQLDCVYIFTRGTADRKSVV